VTKSKTILVVEDDADIRESLCDAFEDAGYFVRSASNGMEGLEALRHFERPCAIVLDLIMPVMTGNELYDAIQADATLADIPVIISTSDPSRAPSGALLLKKPVNLQTMLKMIGKLCGHGEV
jgi:two-component system, sensor histidine kinase and response regulator